MLHASQEFISVSQPDQARAAASHSRTDVKHANVLTPGTLQGCIVVIKSCC